MEKLRRTTPEQPEVKETLSTEEALESVRDFAQHESADMQHRLSEHQDLDKRMGQHSSEVLRKVAYELNRKFEPEMVESLIKSSDISIPEKKGEKSEEEHVAQDELNEISEEELAERLEKKQAAQEELDAMHETLAIDLAEKVEKGETVDVEKWIDRSLSDMLDMYTESDRRNRMTQLYTKRELLRRSADALSKAEKNKDTLVFYNVDADMFKAWNDAFGHIVGDVVLQVIAFEMHEFAKEQKDGIASRVGGEELTGMYVVPQGEDFDGRQIELFQERVGKRLSSLINTIQEEVGDSFDVRERLMQTLFDVRRNEVDGVIMQHQEFNAWLESAKELGGVEDGTQNPSTAYLDISMAIDRLDQANDQEKIKALQEKQVELSRLLPLGTVTVGAIQVDVSTADHSVSKQDTQKINSRINSKDTRQTISDAEIRKVFTEEEITTVERDNNTLIELKEDSLTYVELEERIETRLKDISDTIRTLSTELAQVPTASPSIELTSLQMRVDQAVSEKTAWEGLLDQIMHARVGRIIERADITQETQKKKQRDSVAIEEPISIKAFDNNELDDEEEKEPSEYEKVHAEIARSTRKFDQDLRIELEEMSAKTIDEIRFSDPRMEQWKRSVRFLKHSFKRHEAYNKEVTIGSNGQAQTINLQDHIQFMFDVIEKQVEASFTSNLSEKYLDSLLRSPNDTYKEGILPTVVNQAYKRKRTENQENDPTHFSVVSFDFDNLKAVNEVAGHSFGDTVLRLSAVEYKKMAELNPGVQFIRPSGGEEFILIAPDKTDEETAALVEETANKVSVKVKELLENTVVDGKTVYKMVQEYIEKESGRTGDELDKIGTITAAVIDIADKKEMSAEALVREADELGEKMKHIGMRGETYTEKDLHDKIEQMVA